MTATMIEINHLRKEFGPIVAVDDVSFTVERGEVLGFLGPNGAGKSTTMKVVTGFLPPTSGSVKVGGHDVVRDAIAAKRMVGYLPEGAPAYSDMTPGSYLKFIAEVRGLRGATRKARIEEVVRRVHLDSVMRQPIDTLSKGFRRRVGLAQAILSDPDVLIMDEPTDGLDPNQKHEVRALIREMASRKAIVLSTHILEEVEAVCTRAIIISRGRIVADGSPSELQQRSRFHNAVQVCAKAASPELVAELRQLANVAAVEVLDASDGRTRCRVFAKNGSVVIGDVNQRLRARGWEVVELHAEAGRLDDVFRSITEGEVKVAHSPGAGVPGTGGEA